MTDLADDVMADVDDVLTQIDERPIEEQFAELLDPFKQMLRLVGIKRDKTRAELDRLQAEYRQIERAIKAIDPTFEGERKKTGPKSKSTKPSSNGQVGQGRVDAVQTWLFENREYLAQTYSKGYTASDLKRDERFLASEPGQYGADSVLAALRVLYDRGVMRLDHRGTGGSKYYALVGPS